jgi:ubiquinone/menaquinone biosynthesis C-methylase UbiE
LVGVNAYDPVAEKYSATFGRIELRIFEWPWLKGRLRELSPAVVLDLGCGNGYLSGAIHDLGLEVIGADPSPEMIARARLRLGDSVRVVQAPAEDLPFADGAVNLVVSFLSFRYMEWPQAIEEMHRVLSPDGRLIIIDLFSSLPLPWIWPRIAVDRARVARQYKQEPEYAEHLRRLARDAAWKHLVREHPKRALSAATHALGERFLVVERRLLCAGVRGKTVGLVMVKA